jgi:riboflavin synthase
MFTGIITDIGRIEAVEPRGDLRVRIACGYDMSAVDLGASIACSGACLTVVDKGEGWFAVDVSAETRSRTAPAMWAEGRRLNLERPLKVGDELGGHIVTGHVDGIGEVAAADASGDSVRIGIVAGIEVAPYVAVKGSIALDGVSLTVNQVESLPGGGVAFSVNIIPHSAAQTTFGEVKAGDRLNIEIDILARYLGRMMELRATAVADYPLDIRNDGA